ncbi:hypothetical protein yaldo0001_35920 [Yersinia aldovae ATCC 35236]|uniref:Inner membrane protein n=1 Tax=Yersinia aldovae TaxID=29483 RepID=A0A0T9T8M0_YERAL|nr:hypothetical protein [Yersinia aldovae]EEP96610.1 hypothetical protein yaldo0001_35920 [Yersinia aldovae ATCC 35236]CNJ00053.1 putative inner membrane protein [Yersinia aldovae]CNK68268.1 putative inner membrane protein [Yersinia aldovae]CNK72996.1 putative inner membrane protein [Yersinia aldovae]
MSTEIFITVLGMALLHACWNALVKIGNDRFVTIALMAIFSDAISLTGVIFTGLPSLAALPWLLLSVFFHTGYCRFLSKAYEQALPSRDYLCFNYGDLYCLLCLMGRIVGPA